MSATIIREATETDFARVAELISATQPEPVTEANGQEWELRVLAGQIRRRVVAVVETGLIAGYFRQLYDVNFRAVQDDPTSTGNWVSYEEFERTLRGASWFDPRGQIMALDTNTNAVIGLAAVGFFPSTNRAVNMITGVERAYRGRKIAQALKLLTIRYAQTRGAGAIVTNNDSQNAVVLAINRKLGYVPRPAFFRLLRPV